MNTPSDQPEQPPTLPNPDDFRDPESGLVDWRAFRAEAVRLAAEEPEG